MSVPNEILIVDELMNKNHADMVYAAVNLAEEWLYYGMHDKKEFDHEDMCVVCQALVSITYVDTLN